MEEDQDSSFKDMSFQISSLPARQFEHLFRATSDELASLHVMRKTVTTKPGFPCRVSLRDAEIGEEVLLVNYEHQSASTPYKASHAVYVRVSAQQAELAADEIPDMLRTRTLSLRGFDSGGMMVAAELAEGQQLEEAIESLFLSRDVAYLHLHFAKPGCYAARVDRS